MSHLYIIYFMKLCNSTIFFTFSCYITFFTLRRLSLAFLFSTGYLSFSFKLSIDQSLPFSETWCSLPFCLDDDVCLIHLYFLRLDLSIFPRSPLVKTSSLDTFPVLLHHSRYFFSVVPNVHIQDHPCRPKGSTKKLQRSTDLS